MRVHDASILHVHTRKTFSYNIVSPKPTDRKIASKHNQGRNHHHLAASLKSYNT